MTGYPSGLEDIREATAVLERMQQLLLTQLPLALPTIMTGVKFQMIMMALSMVVIAAMISPRFKRSYWKELPDEDRGSVLKEV